MIRVKRLEFAFQKGEWSFDKCGAGCLIFGTPMFYFIWRSKECVCNACKNIECTCKDNNENT